MALLLATRSGSRRGILTTTGARLRRELLLTYNLSRDRWRQRSDTGLLSFWNLHSETRLASSAVLRLQASLVLLAHVWNFL